MSTTDPCRVGIVGAGLLDVSFSSQPGSGEFYVLTVGVAGTLAAGTILSQARPPAGIQPQLRPGARSVVTSLLAGVGAFGVFYGIARLARRAPALQRAISGALAYQNQGPDSSDSSSPWV